MTNAVRVSVIMATYNCELTIGEALASLHAQTFDDWELVVCDDASTDGTAEHLHAFAIAHPGQVTVLENTINQKLAFSLNRCLTEVSGELVARFDGDDRMHPVRFERQVEFLDEHPEVSVVGTAMRRFNGSSTADVLKLEAEPDRWSMRHGVPFAHATIMMRRDAYELLGGYTVARRTERGQDRDLWFRFFHAGLIGRNLAEPLYEVREDLAAIRRRTWKARYGSFQTAIIGFRSLGYPLTWYRHPVLALAKGLVPDWAFVAYRSLQARKAAQAER